MRHVMFQLVFRPTREADKFCADDAHFIMGDRDSIHRIWWELHKVAGWPHVEVFNMAGEKQEPEKGFSGYTGACA